LLPPAVKAIKGENRYNIDKAGIIKGIEDNSLMIRSANKRFIQKKHSGSKVWTLFIECINATGKALHPLVI
jgi:hypothetical protein